MGLSAMRAGYAAVVAMTTLGLIAGCGSNDSDTPDVATVTPASAALAPATATKPAAGQVIPLPSGGRNVAVDHAGRTLAILSADGKQAWLSKVSDITAPPRVLDVAPLSRIIARPDGGFVGVGPKSLILIGDDGALTRRQTGIGEPLSVASIADGHLLVGTANGHVVEFDANGTQVRDIGGLVRADDIAVHGDQIVVLDRAQSSVTQLKLSDGELGLSLRVGNGATTLISDRYGRFISANTRDGEVVGFFGDPLVMRFRGAVDDAPYALAYDDKSNLLWVSVTGRNEVVAYDLGSGEPVEKRRIPTVAQPDSMAFDQASGTLYVVSATGAGVAAVSR
ncbi:YncE family protein [Gordonia sp. CPCC 205333]|uniref:YncE family protein n=1 Tax=Gordonia sp. CPCC 205333 TaxID=3140790 RepID=UPI003AF33DB3